VTKLHLVGLVIFFFLVGLVINTTKLGLKVQWFVDEDKGPKFQEPYASYDLPNKQILLSKLPINMIILFKICLSKQVLSSSLF
jgi:hypothetical protein